MVSPIYVINRDSFTIIYYVTKKYFVNFEKKKKKSQQNEVTS